MKHAWFLLATLLAAPALAQECHAPGTTTVQALGTGGERRAAPGLVLWQDGKARVYINPGSDTLMRFRDTGARANDLDVMLLTDLRMVSTSDLPPFVDLAQREKRDRALPIYGPANGRVTPGTIYFVRSLFDDKRGVWRELGEVLSPVSKSAFRLDPHDVGEKPTAPIGARKSREPRFDVFHNDRVTVLAQPGGPRHSPVVSWRIDAGARRVGIANVSVAEETFAVLAGSETLILLANGTSDAGYGTRAGQLAHRLQAARLVLLAPRGKSDELVQAAKRQFLGPVSTLGELDCLKLEARPAP